MYCKLDRALVNSRWIELFTLSEVIFLVPGTSDHSPCLVQFSRDPVNRRHMFKYCKMWAYNPRFLDIVRTAWSTEVTGTLMYILVRKLKAVKQSLKTLHRNDYDKIESRVLSKKLELDQIQNDLSMKPTCHDL